MVHELHYTMLKNFCTKEDFTFKSTKEVPEPLEIIGQPRAYKAMMLGLKIRSSGYNIYVNGLPGSGKSTFSKLFAEKIAKTEPPPNDLCYIYNFDNPKKPISLSLPNGYGKILKQDMQELIIKLLQDLPKATSSIEFEHSKNEIINKYQEKRDTLIDSISKEAELQNFIVQSTSSGIYFTPLVNGEILSEYEYENLDLDKKRLLDKATKSIDLKASAYQLKIKKYENIASAKIEDFEYSTCLFIVGHHISLLLKKYKNHDKVLTYFLSVKENILKNIKDFLIQSNTEDNANFNYYNNTDQAFWVYQVNLLVDNSGLKDAPVILGVNPTYERLAGLIPSNNDNKNQIDDFMKISKGLLHKANGGYLILDANDILNNINCYETIKKLLITNKLKPQPSRESSNNSFLFNITPQSIKIDVKIILIGSLDVYEALINYDDYFKKLFKINVTFDTEMDYSKNAVYEITSFVNSFVDEENSLKFSNEAICSIIEYSSKLAKNQKKLSTQFGKIKDLLVESTFFAKELNLDTVTSTCVSVALKNNAYINNLIQEKTNNFIYNNNILINTLGHVVGQINGLAVYTNSDYTFGVPIKITATTYAGKCGIINIEKKSNLSGDIHDKGFEILTGYLGSKYAQTFPLSLSCRICIEQNHSIINGDSASIAELFALLSSLCNLPINQQIAVTGSMNQWGEVQPIGDITPKIEGFFDICNKRGLTGNQGVIIPLQNVEDLVLCDKVIEAVKAKEFHIYPITHIEEGFCILTDILNKDDHTPHHFNSLVYEKLKSYYNCMNNI
jgi:predicted ATP-dependent protease